MFALKSLPESQNVLDYLTGVMYIVSMEAMHMTKSVKAVTEEVRANLARLTAENIKLRRCSTCDGDGKIMRATGDDQHPLQAIDCPNCGGTGKEQYFFFGITVDYVTFATYIALFKQGTCPFCHRTGLTGRYGSNKKHVKACKARPAKVAA